ncbi:uncharacterized protein LOC143231501 [Tachypleus tridentatus]|uniref:uncharacterized protein LOC143231501 n=1 Tax=Tachypleus tridentatus TaxID=6853 RepID=UPI003FD38506
MRKYLFLFHIMCLCCCLPQVFNHPLSSYINSIDNTNESNGDNDFGLQLDNLVNRRVGHHWFPIVQHKKRYYHVNKRHMAEGIINSDLTTLILPYKIQEKSNKVLNALSHIPRNEQQTIPFLMATPLQSNNNFKNRHSLGFEIENGLLVYGLDHAELDLLGEKNTLPKYLYEHLTRGSTGNIVKKHNLLQNVKRISNLPKYNLMNAVRLGKKPIKVYDLEFPQQNKMAQESKFFHNQKKITENQKISFFHLFTILRDKKGLNQNDENSQSRELNRLLSNSNRNGSFCDLKTGKTRQGQTNSLPVKKLFYSRGWGPGGGPLKMHTTYSLEDENPEIKVTQIKPNDGEVNSPPSSYFSRHRLGKWKVGHLFGPYW